MFINDFVLHVLKDALRKPDLSVDPLTNLYLVNRSRLILIKHLKIGLPWVQDKRFTLIIWSDLRGLQSKSF